MIEPPSDEDRRHAAANYLHFEDEDPGKWDIYFDTFDEAVAYINMCEWSFGSEDWEPFGLFEKRIECKDCHGSVVGQLLMLTVKLWED